MKKLLPVFFWWFSFAVLWSVFKLFSVSEYISELVVKPLIWFGVAGIFIYWQIIPKKVLGTLEKEYFHWRPIGQIFLLPFLFITDYFFLINFHSVGKFSLNLSLLSTAIAINFMTSIVEETIFRGILYVWLLKIEDEVTAFLLVQMLFFAVHLPTLLLNSKSALGFVSHAFFILLGGAIYTVVVRINKSLYSAYVMHGVWDMLAFYFFLK